jgi:hypothetical protein
MRIRSIKPEFWRSSDISRLEIEDRLLFIGLWQYVDDNGVGIDKLSAIAADLFADDLERDAPETLARVSRGLERLSEANRVLRYTVRDRRYLVIIGWEHQKIDHPSRPRYPLPNGDVARADSYSRESLATPSRGFERVSANSPLVTGEQRNRGTEEKPPPNARATRLPDNWRPPQTEVDKMRTECPTVDLKAEHLKFVDHYRSKAGPDATKVDWTATWRNWMRRTNQFGPTRPTTNGTRRQADTDQQFDEMLARAAAKDQQQKAIQ